MDYTVTHLSDEDIARYCGRSLPPVELLAADDHLELCDACYARMTVAQGLDDKVIVAGNAFEAATDSEITHLTYEQMAAMADNQLDDIDREVIGSHLELCRRCETELNDLREVSSAMDVSAAEQPTSRAPSLQERFISLWPQPGFRIPAPAFAALAVAALAILLMYMTLRMERAVLQARVAELEHSNQTLKGQAAAVEGMQNEVAAMRDENSRLRQAVESHAEMLVALNDGGGRVTLDTDGNLLGVRPGLRDEQTIKDALKNGRVLLPPSIRELRGGPSGTLMGGDGRTGFKLLAPVGVVIESAQPNLRWSALEGAASYTVTVYDFSSGLTEVAASGPLTTTQWSMPTALARGRTYVWQVRAVKDGSEVVAPAPTESRVKFKVLERDKVEEVERARKSQAKSHLVMGVVYAEAGLLDEAAREFDALLRDNPKSPIARRLLQSVRSARR